MEEKYSEVFETAKGLYLAYKESYNGYSDKGCEQALLLKGGMNLLEDWFPHLKEGEDERIRKALIWCVETIEGEFGCKDAEGIAVAELKSWLDKQGEQKPVDKVEPKFHEGDWIVHHGTENIYQVVAIIDNQYQLKYGDTYTIQKCTDVDRCARLWDITKDAKAGDILISAYNQPFIFNGKFNDYGVGGYCGLIYNGEFELGEKDENNWTKNEGIVPAEKEERELLFTKMKENGYWWDEENLAVYEIANKPEESEESAFDFYDAKPGDILADECSGIDMIFIFKDFEHEEYEGYTKPSDYHSYCFLKANNHHDFSKGAWHHKHNIRPATKEERELLFRRMEEAGYEWDSDKLEVRYVGISDRETSGYYRGIINPYNGHNRKLVDKICDAWDNPEYHNKFGYILYAIGCRDKVEINDKLDVVIGDVETAMDNAHAIMENICDDEDLKMILSFIRYE